MRNVTDAFATFLKHQISAPNRLSGMEHGLELAVYWGDTFAPFKAIIVLAQSDCRISPVTASEEVRQWIPP